MQVKRIESDTDRDSIFAQGQAERTRADAEAHQAELQFKLNLATLEYANREKVSLGEVRARLAETAMKLQTQKELSVLTAGGKPHATPQVSKPPTEPAGRAPAGEAYQA